MKFIKKGKVMKKNLILGLVILVVMFIASTLKPYYTEYYYVDKFSGDKINYSSSQSKAIDSFFKQIISTDRNTIIQNHGEGNIYFGNQPQIFSNAKEIFFYQTKTNDYIISILENNQENLYICNQKTMLELLEHINNITQESIVSW